MEGDLQRALGRNLRLVRHRLGLSQEAMAERLDLHRTYVGGLERGERNVTLQTVERIGALAGVHPIDLLWDRQQVAVVIDVDGAAHLDERPRLQAAADGDPPVAPAVRRRRPAPPA